MIIKQSSKFSFIFSMILVFAGASSLAGPGSESDLIIKGTSLQAPLALGALSVIHNEDGFSVLREGKSRRVQSHFLDKSLRGISRGKLKNLLKNNGYLRVNQSSNGEYLLQAQGRLNGGGAGGATAGAYFGKFLVHFVGHGAILIAGAMTGAAAPATIASLEATFGPTIEAASVVAAAAGGIAGGVATGPV